MSFNPEFHTGRLNRLLPKYYKGRSFVHWTMSTENCVTGWLDLLHHAFIREMLCHSLSKHRLLCPAYCLLPDHAHLLWLGHSEIADQLAAVEMFRRFWNQQLRRQNFALQRQAFDLVLSRVERDHGALNIVATYILNNPVRLNLTKSWQDYPFSGAVLPGFPDLNPRSPNFWARFWGIYNSSS